MGCQSNNVAEYGGLILGLNLERSKGAVRVEVRGDSKLVINQMGYGWACRKLPLIRLQRVARRFMRDFTAGVDFTWVPREKNKDSDKLADAQAKREDARCERRTLFFTQG